MSNLPAAGAKTGGYVPPSLRNRAAGDTGDSMNKRREENSVRVTNLSEDTREDDLRVSMAVRSCSVFCVGQSTPIAMTQCLLSCTKLLGCTKLGLSEVCRCEYLQTPEQME